MHKPSETSRAKVIALITNGCQQSRVAEHLAIDAKTLRKHYARELEFGTETLLSKVLNNLASIAIKGRGYRPFRPRNIYFQPVAGIASIR